MKNKPFIMIHQMLFEIIIEINQMLFHVMSCL